MVGKITDKLRLRARLQLGLFTLATVGILAKLFRPTGHIHEWRDAGILIAAILVTAFIFGWLITRSIKKQLETVTQNLGYTSEHLLDAAQGMSESSQKLAEGSTQQSASVQETSATMEEASSLVHQTTQNTKEAVSLAERTKGQADDGVESVDKLLESMKQLTKSSDEVQKVIKVIDDMAFQTNILSLNAAVEAARAGDAGKGFAVVAEEVRNLAQRSAQAAQETAVLIDGNVEITKNAVILSERVGKELKGINASAVKVKELLDEIATASQEQEIAANQVSQAIAQIDQVIQMQASIAQAGARDASTLEEDCNKLKDIMYQLISIVKNPESYYSKSSYPQLEYKKGKSNKLSGGKATESFGGGNRRGGSTQSALPGSVAVNPEDVIPLEDF